jgi:hypothetical protein
VHQPAHSPHRHPLIKKLPCQLFTTTIFSGNVAARLINRGCNMNSEQIINDICEIAASPHDKQAFKDIVTQLYRIGVIDGHMQAIEQLRNITGEAA